MADGLITVEELREIFDIDPLIKDPRFTRALAAAGRRMRTWVGDEAYDDALLVIPVDETRKADLQYAEAHLVMGFAVLGINTSLRREGIVRSEKVEGSSVLTYHSPAEIERLQAQYFDEAEQLARSYLLTDGTPGPPLVVTSDEGSETATCLCGCPASKCSTCR